MMPSRSVVSPPEVFAVTVIIPSLDCASFSPNRPAMTPSRFDARVQAYPTARRFRKMHPCRWVTRDRHGSATIVPYKFGPLREPTTEEGPDRATLPGRVEPDHVLPSRVSCQVRSGTTPDLGRTDSTHAQSSDESEVISRCPNRHTYLP